MVFTITLNQNNLVPDGLNSTWEFRFPNSISFPNHEIAVMSVATYYSWTNINVSPLGNNTFSLFYPTNTAGAVSSGTLQTTTVAITIPTGQYNISDLNNLLQSQMIASGLYFINSAGQNVYYAEIVISATQYKIQINTFPLPLSTSFTWNAVTGVWTGNAGTAFVGWTTPVANTANATAAFAGFPNALAGTTQYNPFLLIPANFNAIVGFAVGTYTIGASSGGSLVNTGFDTAGLNRSYVSTLTPQVQPNPSVFLVASNILNKFAVPNTIIYSFNANVGFGQLIVDKPQQFAWNALIKGTYNNLRLSITGLNFQPLTLLDPTTTIVLLIRDTTTEASSLLAAISGGK